MYSHVGNKVTAPTTLTYVGVVMVVLVLVVVQVNLTQPMYGRAFIESFQCICVKCQKFYTWIAFLAQSFGI